jgi:N-hydroxyarylamine O-acetyltransferase
MNLDAYFARIGYSGPRTPSLATLNALVLAHVSTIPFENLDVLLGRPIRLDLDAVLAKLVTAGRGGYCFEQNGLFLEVLRELGFAVRPISARVRLQRPRDFTPPRTHMFVRVEIEGESWLADVGVGALSPTAALRLETDLVQETPHEARRLIAWEGRLLHQALLGDDWADVCEFTLEEMPPIDREVANWFTSAHPGSHFRNRLIAARAVPGGRMTLLNRDFTVRGADGVAHTERLADPDALLAVLSERFGLDFPAGTEFHCADLVWD